MRVVSPTKVLVTLDRGRQHLILPGVQDVPEEVGTHWYAKAHGVKPLDGEPKDRATTRDPAPHAVADQDVTSADVVQTSATTPDRRLDEMADTELRQVIMNRDGKAPHHATGRTKLLDMARGTT